LDGRIDDAEMNEKRPKVYNRVTINGEEFEVMYMKVINQ
jgi:hypothetical protein